MSQEGVHKGPLVCTDCREKSASLLSCIHTFPPRVRKSSILSEANAIPGVIGAPESDDRSFNPVLVERSRAVMPSDRRVPSESVAWDAYFSPPERIADSDDEGLDARKRKASELMEDEDADHTLLS